MARSAFHKLFVLNLLPRLVIFNNYVAFKGVVSALYRLLIVACTLVAPENNRAVQVKHFFRYFNKSDKIKIADFQIFSTWIQVAYFPYM